MRWMRFAVRTNEESEDILISSMADIGLQGAQIEDNAPLTASERERMFSDDAYTDEPPEDDGSATVSFYAELAEDGRLSLSGSTVNYDVGEEAPAGESSEADAEGNGAENLITPEELQTRMEAVIEELRQFSEIGEGTITVSVTEDVDWENSWKEFFHKFYVDEDILIIPSWEQPDAEDLQKAEYILRMDPGTAFGTGMHESTQLCIHQLRRYLFPGAQMLDIGIGSGVLSILSAMFGAGHIVGTDLDPKSMPAVAENMEANEIEEGQIEAMIGNLIDDPDTQLQVGRNRYDVAVANILPVVLVPLMPAAAKALKAGGILIVSGIMGTEEEPEGKCLDVMKAMRAAGLDIVETTNIHEWYSITAVKL